MIYIKKQLLLLTYFLRTKYSKIFGWRQILWKKQLATIGIITLLVYVGLSGCSSLTSDKVNFVGTWKTSIEVNLVLFSNGKCTIAGVSRTWDVKDNMLVIVLANLPAQSTFSYMFLDDDKTVVLT